jgi:uroporphyrinogen-III decarboxylase
MYVVMLLLLPLLLLLLLLKLMSTCVCTAAACIKQVGNKATVLGFVGLPYTLATYLVEGATSK